MNIAEQMALSFAAHLEVLPLDGRGLATIGEQGCDVYSGAPFAKVADLVDGSADEAVLLAGCDESEREPLAAAIAELRRTGVLVERASAGNTDAEAWWSSQFVPPAAAAARLHAATVHLQALGDVDPAEARDALSDAGLRVDKPADLTIVVVDDYLDDDLPQVNETALLEGRPWMLAQPQGAPILIGPVFAPGRGPCWECLAERLRYNRRTERQLRTLAGGLETNHRVARPPSQRRLGAELLATEAARWLVGARLPLESMLLSFDIRAWESAAHRVVWRPQCPACGEGDASLHRGAVPIRIRRRAPRGASRNGGGDSGSLRGVSPRLTLERYAHHVDPITGPVRALTKLSGWEHLHAYASGGPAVRIHGDRDPWQSLIGSQSGGKGITDELARASALCEALERHSGQFFGDEPRRGAAFEDLGEEALHPNDYMRFSDAQYEERENRNQRARSLRSFVPERFDPGVRIDWSPVWSLTRERERLVPTALCYYGARDPGHRSCVAESNGNAAGNTVEEAILHGLLELVERDHVALWWYNRTTAPTVDLDSIQDASLSALRDRVASEKRDCWALDLTADLGIPVAAMLVASADGSGVGMGFGAHLDLAGAVIRAGNELTQLGLGAPSGGLGSGVDRGVHLSNNGFARPHPDSPTRSCAGETRFDGDVTAALDVCRGAIEQQGIELLVLDQTRPDLGLPVVKVLAPGLRHFWARFGPGRLYDVPVALGRLDRAHSERELNPTPPVS